MHPRYILTLCFVLMIDSRWMLRKKHKSVLEKAEKTFADLRLKLETQFRTKKVGDLLIRLGPSHV